MTRRLVFGFSLIIVLLETLFISYMSYNNFINLQIIVSNSFISDKAITVFFKKDGAVPSLYELTNRYPYAVFLLELYNNPDLHVWGICGNHFLDSKSSSLIEGRFFEKNDFFKGSFRAVLGKNVLNSDNCIEGKDGKKYFILYDNYYEVIGSISSNITNMLDNTAFVNLDSFDIKLCKYVIDSVNSKSIVTTINSMQKEYNVDIVRKNSTNLIERYIFNDVDKNILDFLVAVFIVMLIIMLTMFTLRYYSEEIKVIRILGISFKRIFLNLIKNIILLTLVNTTFVVIIYAFIYYIFFQKVHLDFYFYSLILFLFIVLAVICLIMYLYLLISNKLFYKNGVK